MLYLWMGYWRSSSQSMSDQKYKKQAPSLDLVKFLSFNILSALVLICSSCIATTNASTSLKKFHMSSSHSSLNNASFVSKTHHLVHHDTLASREEAHFFSNVYKEDLVEHSAKLSRSRKPRGKNKLYFSNIMPKAFAFCIRLVKELRHFIFSSFLDHSVI